uniref:Uncharacterized protein n=1 Tax=Cyprinus carpio TaxID=7962 RepID=A0A8C1LPE2_CYPCA
VEKSINDINLEEARTVDESDIILVFCPIVSRAGTDIDAALKNYVYPTGCFIIIPAVVIFLHKTLDSDSVPNSSGHVKSRDVLVVDCIFCDGKGLPDCEKNREAISAVADWIKNKVILIFSKNKISYCRLQAGVQIFTSHCLCLFFDSYHVHELYLQKPSMLT